jgi:carbon storage regulator
MLILTRRIGETVVVGRDVRVTVVGIKGRQVRMVINAPKNVPVHREEIFNRILQQQDAGNTSADAPVSRHHNGVGSNRNHSVGGALATRWQDVTASKSGRSLHDSSGG